MEITVTDRHIREGIRLSSCRNMARSRCCPVALALAEQTNKGYYVCTTEFLSFENGKRSTLPVPPVVQKFIRRFDNALEGKGKFPLAFKFLFPDEGTA